MYPGADSSATTPDAPTAAESELLQTSAGFPAGRRPGKRSAIQNERKRCQRIHIAHLGVPFAAFEHRAAPESGERGRIDRWFYPQVAGFFASDRKRG